LTLMSKFAIGEGRRWASNRRLRTMLHLCFLYCFRATNIQSVLDIQPVMSYFAPLRQLIIHPCIQYACFSSNCPIFECFVFILGYGKKKLKFAYNGVVVQSCYSWFLSRYSKC
jgi:hypothetical protein